MKPYLVLWAPRISCFLKDGTLKSIHIHVCACFPSILCVFILQVWTHYPLHSNHTPYISRDPPVRDHYSYQDLVLMSLEGDPMSDASLDSENMEESGRALAFFDQLIQDEHSYGSSS